MSRADSLYQKGLKYFNNKDYENARSAASEYLTELEKNKDENFGNARDVRNFFEKVLEKQAVRVSFMGNISEKDMLTIEKEDIITYIPTETKKTYKIGF